MSDVVERANAALEGATEGPWSSTRFVRHWSEQGQRVVTTTTLPEVVANCLPNNAEFIAQARTLVPELVAEIEDLRKITDIIDPDSVYREQRDQAWAERDAANAEVERLRAIVERVRALHYPVIDICDEYTCVAGCGDECSTLAALEADR